MLGVFMSQKKAAGGVATLFQNTPCQDSRGGCRVFTSKQLQPAMTNSVYTKPIKSRKPTAKISPKHCELDADLSLIFKQANQSYCTNRVTPRTTRQSNWNHVDRAPLVRHWLDTMMERAVSITGELK
jgi:hypothetical protein